jgi:tetratricopeptide (TPR) repeat protein
VNLLDELGRREKAFEILKQLLAKASRPDAWILNRMAMLVDEIGDGEEAIRLYEAAAGANDRWDVPLFNLALRLRRAGDPEGATAAALRAAERERTAPTLTLSALALGDGGHEAAKKKALEEARALWDPVATLDSWELGWKIAWARAADDQIELKKARAEQDRRSKGATSPNERDGGLLPALGAEQ